MFVIKYFALWKLSRKGKKAMHESYREPVYHPPVNYYQPLRKKNFHWAISLFFMFWYLVLIVPVTFSLFVSFWAVAVSFSLCFVVFWFQREIFPPEWSYNNWIFAQSDALIYTVGIGATVLGVVLVWAMLKATVPFFKAHLWLLRGMWS
jgi:uncharacterized membrane protein